MPVSDRLSHILVGDDEPALRAGMARVLASEGYQVQKIQPAGRV
jgi:DNA-binding response OmpR family regulator